MTRHRLTLGLLSTTLPTMPDYPKRLRSYNAEHYHQTLSERAKALALIKACENKPINKQGKKP